MSLQEAESEQRPAPVKKVDDEAVLEAERAAEYFKKESDGRMLWAWAWFVMFLLAWGAGAVRVTALRHDIEGQKQKANSYLDIANSLEDEKRDCISALVGATKRETGLRQSLHEAEVRGGN